MNQKSDSDNSCAFCRFMRGLAFGAIGGGLAGYSALWLGVSREYAVVAAFFGALGTVVWASRKRPSS